MTTESPVFEISLFGEPHLTYGGRAWRFRGPRISWTLLALLVGAPHPLDRSSVASALWPDCDEAILTRFLEAA